MAEVVLDVQYLHQLHRHFRKCGFKFVLKCDAYGYNIELRSRSGVTCIITLSLFLIQLLYHITTVVIMKSKEVEVLKEE